MLYLSRKAGESILIGKDITITIIERHHHYLQIGIDAPKDVLILREELLDRPDRKGQVTGEKTRFSEENEL